jgi:holo-[acyl-carrier protein] synthase
MKRRCVPMERRILRVGTDLVTVADVAQSISSFGSRYLTRIYTSLELRQAGGRPESIAARFAGKEAVIKLLRPHADVSVPPIDIEIALLPSGAPHVRLKRAALRLADDGGAGGMSVALSHERGTALAVAAAHFAAPQSEAAVSEAVLTAIRTHGGITGPVTALDPDQDLGDWGVSPEARSRIFLSLEDELAIMIPDEAFTESASAASITRLVESLTRATPRKATRP